MIVEYERIGGWASVWQGCRLDSDSMPREEARQLEALVLSSGILAGFRTLTHMAGPVKHKFDITDGKKHVQLTIDQFNVPRELRPLLDFLQPRLHDLDPHGE